MAEVVARTDARTAAPRRPGQPYFGPRSGLHTIVAVTGMQHVTARRAAIALALGLLLACAAPAVAHDELVASRPVNGALLAAPPRA